ncbi:MAG: two-component system, NarL family, nitrate/nitrite response regulator NarL [Gaiellales bacterium]|jgi:two-component system nitrate/nitrite response regulator NarL|nr:two-component system, NarL family, nitrate/nitrite response regulator NarL [Gaiellales bacterium]
MGVSLLIADDHPVYRSGLAEILRGRPEFEVVGEAGDGATALAEIRRLAPDVAVVDLQLPDMDGIAVAEAVAREGLATRVVILSAYEDRDVVQRAFAVGARAYLPKICSAERLCDTLLAVARGQIVLPGVPAAAPQVALTARETEILRLTADGRSAPEIAATLAVSSATVKTHLQHVYEKLGVSDRAAAVAQAIRRGLLD